MNFQYYYKREYKLWFSLLVFSLKKTLLEDYELAIR